MNLPLELSFRDGTKSEDIEALVRQKAAQLERYNDHISSCRVAVEKPQEHVRSGSGYRVRVDLTVPPRHELVARREPGQGSAQEDLQAVIRDVFVDAGRQLKELNDRQRGKEKAHPEQQRVGIVIKLFDDYGFLRSVDGRDVYFHRRGVLNNDFDRLVLGSGVNYSEEMGEKGLHASTVRLVDKPGKQEE
ncbi:MAG: HPF/RaiA family ribosome-associated protein [Alkalispirochaetaceae bacterium]